MNGKKMIGDDLEKGLADRGRVRPGGLGASSCSAA
jgi:hypothetical protein